MVKTSSTPKESAMGRSRTDEIQGIILLRKGEASIPPCRRDGQDRRAEQHARAGCCPACRSSPFTIEPS